MRRLLLFVVLVVGTAMLYETFTMPEYVVKHRAVIASVLAALLAGCAAFFSYLDQQESSTQLIALHRKSWDYVTGGDGFAYHHFVVDADRISQVRSYNDSSNPVYVVRESIHNITLALQRIRTSDRTQPLPGEVVRVDSERFLRPQSSAIFNRFALPHDGNGDYFIWFNQRNAEICQVLGLREVDGKPEFAYHVFRVIKRVQGVPQLETQPVKSFATANYPRNSDTGKYEWIDDERWKLAMIELTRSPVVGDDSN